MRALIALVALALVGCGGGAPSAPKDVRNSFIQAAAADGLQISFVSNSGRVANTVIVKDQGGFLNAYDLTNYTAGQDFSEWLTANMNAVSGRLAAQWGTTCTAYDSLGGCTFFQDIVVGYLDPNTNVLYEETGASSKDLQKLAAFKQTLQVQHSAQTLKARFGLSDDRSNEVARLAVQLAKTPARSMTDADYDSFSREITGTSFKKLSAAMKASREGNTKSLNDIIDTAAKVNGVGPEHMNAILKELTN